MRGCLQRFSKANEVSLTLLIICLLSRLKGILCHCIIQEHLLIIHLDGSVHNVYLFQTQVVNRNY